MKFGLFTAGYQRLPLEAAFADARRFGYDFIELWGGRPHAYAYDLREPAMGKQLRRLQDEFEIPILVYTPELNAYPYNFMQGSEAMRRDCVEYMKAAVEAACGMGARYTLISAGHGGMKASDEALWQRLVCTLRELAEYAEKLGHCLLLEPLTPFESNILTSAEQLRRAVREVSSPALKGMCDVVVPFVQREPILSYIDKLGGDLCHMHITDSNGHSEDHVMPGEGVMPLPELMKELTCAGYDGTVTIELVTNYINEPRLYACRALHRLKELL